MVMGITDLVLTGFDRAIYHELHVSQILWYVPALRYWLMTDWRFDTAGQTKNWTLDYEFVRAVSIICERFHQIPTLRP